MVLKKGSARPKAGFTFPEGAHEPRLRLLLPLPRNLDKGGPRGQTAGPRGQTELEVTSNSVCCCCVRGEMIGTARLLPSEAATRIATGLKFHSYLNTRPLGGSLALPSIPSIVLEYRAGIGACGHFG